MSRDHVLDENADISEAAADILAELPAKEIDEPVVARLQSASTNAFQGRELVGRASFFHGWTTSVVVQFCTS